MGRRPAPRPALQPGKIAGVKAEQNGGQGFARSRRRSCRRAAPPPSPPPAAAPRPRSRAFPPSDAGRKTPFRRFPANGLRPRRRRSARASKGPRASLHFWRSVRMASSGKVSAPARSASAISTRFMSSSPLVRPARGRWRAGRRADWPPRKTSPPWERAMSRAIAKSEARAALVLVARLVEPHEGSEHVFARIAPECPGRRHRHGSSGISASHEPSRRILSPWRTALLSRLARQRLKASGRTVATGSPA